MSVSDRLLILDDNPSLPETLKAALDPANRVLTARQDVLSLTFRALPPRRPIARAMELLDDPKRPVGGVYLDVGLKDPSHFNRVVRKLTASDGRTPHNATQTTLVRSRARECSSHDRVWFGIGG